MAYFIATHYNTRHSPRSGFRASSLRDWPIVFAAPIRKVTTAMQTRPLDPPVDDLAPTEAVLTGYDEQHFVTYLRLLDAAAENADWREVARIVLHIDPDKEPERARRMADEERVSPLAARRRTALKERFLAERATPVAPPGYAQITCHGVLSACSSL
jgi:hypothetical protein